MPCSSLYASACLLLVNVVRLGGRRPWCDGCGGAGSCFSTSGGDRFSMVTPRRLSGRDWRVCMRYDSCSDFAAEEDDNFPERKFVDGRRRDDDWEVLPKTRGNILFMRGLQPGRQPHTTPTPPPPSTPAPTPLMQFAYQPPVVFVFSLLLTSHF